MAAEKTGQSEEELMILALNGMLQFFYPHAEKSWQSVPDDKVRQVYATQHQRPNSAKMSPEEYRDFVQADRQIWFKEMFFLREEDVSRLIEHNSYATNHQHRKTPNNIFKVIGGAIQTLSSKRKEMYIPKSSGGNFDDSFKNAQKPSPPPSPRNIKRRLLRHKPALWMVDPERYSTIVEAFRRLANKIALISDTQKMKVFLMTGSDSQVGTSTILFNTALMMGRSMLDRKILLVDTNIDRPSVHVTFEHSPTVCLMDYMLAEASLADIVQPTFLPNLDIITCKQVDDPLISPFTRPTFSRFFQEAREHYELILLDSAPALRSSHTRMLLPQSDGTIIVAQANKTQTRIMEELVRLLDMEGATLLGSFLNKRKYVIPKWIYRVL